MLLFSLVLLFAHRPKRNESGNPSFRRFVWSSCVRSPKAVMNLHRRHSTNSTKLQSSNSPMSHERSQKGGVLPPFFYFRGFSNRERTLLEATKISLSVSISVR